MDSLTVLVDNIAEKPLKSEHGFSLLIQWKGKRILFDTAQYDSLFHNAAELGVSLEKLDALILSHGHYDHGGNLAGILERNPRMPFYAHPESLKDRYSRHGKDDVRRVSLSEKDRAAVLALPGDLYIPCSGATEVFPGLWISGNIPRVHQDEDTGGAFYLEKEAVHPDLIPDDLSIWLDHGEDISLICGCCHSGLRNTVEYIRQLSGGKAVRMILGGYHLKHAGENRISRTIEFINRNRIRKIVPAHCTGKTAMERFANELDGDVTFSRVGLNVPLA